MTSENTNDQMSFFFFPQKSGFLVKSQDLFWVGMTGKTNNYPRGISHFLDNLEKGRGEKAHSHFGLKDLGHTLTDWLT